MRLRWDWLEPVIHAPYVPTLGPVVPSVLAAGIFHDIIAVSGTGCFLPYDKDRRWFDRKDEHVIAEEITQSPVATVIPTRSAKGSGLIKIHHYSAAPPDLARLAPYGRELCARHGAARHVITWCQHASQGARSRVMVKDFTSRDPPRPETRNGPGGLPA